MRRELKKQLAQIEAYQRDDTVRQISALMDELSAKAAGQTTQDLGNDLLAILEGDDHATP